MYRVYREPKRYFVSFEQCLTVEVQRPMEDFEHEVTILQPSAADLTAYIHAPIKVPLFRILMLASQTGALKKRAVKEVLQIEEIIVDYVEEFVATAVQGGSSFGV